MVTTTCPVENERYIQRILHYTLKYAYNMSPFYRSLFKKADVNLRKILTFEDINILLKGIGLERGKDILLNTIPHGTHTAGFTVFQCSVNAGYSLLNIYTLTPREIATFIKILKRKGRLTIIGLPSKLIQLGDVLKEEEIQKYITNVITTGEHINNNLFKRLSEVWGRNIFNVYGMVEFGCIAYECRYQNGLHVLEENIYIDIRDPYDLTRSLPSGKEGVIVATKLLKPGEDTGSILINYVTNDISKIISRDCHCRCGNFGTKISPPYPRIQRLDKGGLLR